MKRALFAELMQSMHDALDHSRGKRELRTTVLPSTPAPMTAKEVRELRGRRASVARGRDESTRRGVRWAHARGAREKAATRLSQASLRSAPLAIASGHALRASSAVA